MIDETILHPVGDNPPKARLLYGQHALESLKLLEDDSVHAICTSPPYWGLRDYGGLDNQIGIEADLEDYIGSVVAVFEECRRVLRKDGTLWLNLGDTYSRGSRDTTPVQGGLCSSQNDTTKYEFSSPSANLGGHPTIKPKDLIGVPWRVALALQDAGWYLRNDIIWSKGNPMPESVKDRFTKSHEYIFLFAHPDSGGRYYFDSDTVREPCSPTSIKDLQRRKTLNNKGGGSGSFEDVRADLTRNRTDYFQEGGVRNRRTVWDVNTKPFAGAHFAVWPTELVEIMILAGCPEGGTVLDPFSGSASTGDAALNNGRNYIGLDLNEDYFSLASCRMQGVKVTKSKQVVPEVSILDVFGGG